MDNRIYAICPSPNNNKLSINETNQTQLSFPSSNSDKSKTRHPIYILKQGSRRWVTLVFEPVEVVAVRATGTGLLKWERG